MSKLLASPSDPVNFGELRPASLHTQQYGALIQTAGTESRIATLMVQRGLRGVILHWRAWLMDDDRRNEWLNRHARMVGKCVDLTLAI